MNIRIETHLSHNGQSYHELAIPVPNRTFYPAKFIDRRTAERAYDALLAYFSRAGAQLEGNPFDSVFYASVEPRLQTESLARIIGIRGTVRGEKFTQRVNHIISYILSLNKSEVTQVKEALRGLFLADHELEVLEGTGLQIYRKFGKNPLFTFDQLRQVLISLKKDYVMDEAGVYIWTLRRSDFI